MDVAVPRSVRLFGANPAWIRPARADGRDRQCGFSPPDCPAVADARYRAQGKSARVPFAFCTWPAARSRFLVRRLNRNPTPILHFRRFVEVEFGLAIAALLAASSLTSVPPGIDLTEDRVTWQEIVDRNWPIKPTWTSLSGTQPDPSATGRVCRRIGAGSPEGERRCEFREGSTPEIISQEIFSLSPASLRGVHAARRRCVVTAFRPIPVAPGAWDRRVDGR